MSKKRKETNERINAELDGLGLYGTTSNTEIAGYRTSGDIENAGNLKGFVKEDGHRGSIASAKDEHQQD